MLPSIREMVFKSLTKFVLQVLDMVDFQSALEHKVINENCKEFNGCLRDKFDCCSEPAVNY